MLKLNNNNKVGNLSLTAAVNQLGENWGRNFGVSNKGHIQCERGLVEPLSVEDAE